MLVIAYNAELFGGIIHTDLGFAAAWGAFPALTGYAAQDGHAGPGPRWRRGRGARAVRRPAQAEHAGPAIRRRAVEVRGTITLADGSTAPIGPDLILAPLEGALRAMSWGLILLAAAMAVARLR